MKDVYKRQKLMPTHVRIKSSPIPSIALCEQIETVYKKRIGKYLAKATMDEMKQIDKALAVSIGLGGNMKLSLIHIFLDDGRVNGSQK